MKKKKRLATAEEVAKVIAFQKECYPDSDVDAKHQEALDEGYKDEVCEKCGTTFLACHHFIRCEDPKCPMKTPGGKSLLDMMLGDGT